jgi:hypothetical protein
MDKRLERSLHRKVFRRVGSLLPQLGWERGKTTFFVCRRELVVEFVHLHKYSFVPAYRIHLGIRVMNDRFPAAALNGLDSHAYTCPHSPNGSRYTLDFGPDDASVKRCSDEIFRWCSEVGIPWFCRYRDPRALLSDAASPLREEEKVWLEAAMAGESDPACVAASEMLLGLESRVNVRLDRG